jgi:hypothetical protein
MSTAEKGTTSAIINAVRRKPRQLPHPRSVRLPDDVDAAVSRYMEQNRINFNQLCAFALEKYMAEPQSIRFQPISIHEDVGSNGTQNRPKQPC